MESQLYETTLAVLRQSHLPMQRIAQDVGVSEPWLHKMKAGGIPDPGVKKCEALYCYLTGRELKLVSVS